MKDPETPARPEASSGKTVAVSAATAANWISGLTALLGADWSQSGLLESLSRLTRGSPDGLSLALRTPALGDLAVGPDSRVLVELLAAIQPGNGAGSNGGGITYRSVSREDGAGPIRVGLACLQKFGATNDERGSSWLAFTSSRGGSPFPVEGEISRLAVVLSSRLLLEERRERVLLLERFLATVAHELKGPLTAMVGTLELELRLRSRGGSLDSDASAGVAGAVLPASPVLQRVLRELWRMNEMVQALLETALHHGGRFVLEPRPVKFEEWSTRLLEDRLRPLFAEFSVALDSRAIDVPEYVWMDPLRMEELVTNLALFALRSSPEGEPVRLVWTADSAGHELRLAVEDRGPGLSPEERTRLFRPFEAPARVLKRGALGLALYLAREIAQAHGGGLVAEPIETTVGVAGNRLRLAIPCVPPAARSGERKR